nr:unnamed protein product [Callosobruchus analis]
MRNDPSTPEKQCSPKSSDGIISPNGNFQIFCDSLCQIMDSLDIKKGVIFCGDYNVHFGTSDIEACMIEDIFQSYGLRRTVFVETRGKSCLDNIFTNYSNHIISAEVFDSCLSDHKSVSIQYKTDTLPILKTRINYCPITQQGINQLYAAIEACDWTFTNDRSLTPSNKMDIFIETIMRESEKSFPEKSRLIEIEPKCNYRINWFTDEVRYYRECLHLMTSLRKQNPSLVSNSDLREFRNIYRNVIHTAKKNANDSYIKKHSNTQKAMWDVIRSNNPVKATNASQNISANEFNDYFVLPVPVLLQTCRLETW